VVVVAAVRRRVARDSIIFRFVVGGALKAEMGRHDKCQPARFR
jgi:hypothetical protein